MSISSFIPFFPIFGPVNFTVASPECGTETAPVGGTVCSGCPLGPPQALREEVGSVGFLKSPVRSHHTEPADRKWPSPVTGKDLLPQSATAPQKLHLHSRPPRRPQPEQDASSMVHLSQVSSGNGLLPGALLDWAHTGTVHRHQTQDAKGTPSLAVLGAGCKQNHLGCCFNRRNLWVPPGLVLQNRQLPR